MPIQVSQTFYYNYKRQRNIIKPICTNRLRELLKTPCGFNSGRTRCHFLWFSLQDHSEQTPNDDHNEHELDWTELQ